MSFQLYLAIPSPDLVLNLFASAGQVLGLVAVSLGGVALRSPKRGSALGLGSSAASPWPLRMALTALALTVALFLLYHLRVQDVEAARLRANLARPSVEGGREVGDASLKTLSFSGQLAHPAALSTDALAGLIERGERLNLIDVRESEEVEMGRIPGAWARRYPDLQADTQGLERPDTTTVLLCFSGNRSSELVDHFNATGHACKFVIGGYEKWIAEGRPLELGAGRDPADLRALPRAPNDRVLLDTPAVHRAVAESGAVFVDVRYPDEFAAGHLPGALNLPMRKLTSAELERALAAVPKGPVILPCYDKRSSFYASLVGLRLARLGREVLGRYTVPHEYFVAKGEREYVSAWRSAAVGPTPFGMARDLLADGLRGMQRALGSLALSIVALVLALRGALLPWTFRAEVEQARAKRLAPDFAALTERLRDDPVRLRRALAQARARHNLRPLRGLAVSLVQLALFLTLFSSVGSVATGSTERLGWFTLGAPDPRWLLPAAVVALAAALVMLGAARTVKRWLGAGLVAMVLGLLVHRLPAAQNLYLVASLAWIHVHGALARRRAAREVNARRVGRHAARDAQRARATSIVPLGLAHLCDDTGGKAHSLGRLIDAGFPVPDGFVVRDAAFRAPGSGAHALSSERLKELLRAFDRLGSPRVAVRSSGLDEDGAQHSYAGVFDTQLGVERAGLVEAVLAVRASMSSERAVAYRAHTRATSTDNTRRGGRCTPDAVHAINENGAHPEPPARGGVVVQAMVPATHAGVLFTEHPGHTGRSMVELVEGLGEALVSGQATPAAFEFGRLSGQQLEGAAPPVDLAPLLRLGREVEAHYGRPQDIEWAFADGFVLLQARDITADATRGDDLDAAFEAERRRVVAHLAATAPGADDPDFEGPRLATNELVELLPEPTPYSAALMAALWAPGHAVDRACRLLGVPYEPSEEGRPLVVPAFGQVLVDRAEDARRRARKPGARVGWRLSRRAADLESVVRDDLAARAREAARHCAALEPAASAPATSPRTTTRSTSGSCGRPTPSQRSSTWPRRARCKRPLRASHGAASTPGRCSARASRRSWDARALTLRQATSRPFLTRSGTEPRTTSSCPNRAIRSLRSSCGSSWRWAWTWRAPRRLGRSRPRGPWRSCAGSIGCSLSERDACKP
ncbi:MAG: PEP/pyruvate-binding domain-containing protein [Planctomycetota bacterium]